MIALAYLAAAFAALFLCAAAQGWWKVARSADGRNSADTVHFTLTRIRSAASATVIAFGLLVVALVAVVLERLL